MSQSKHIVLMTPDGELFGTAEQIIEGERPRYIRVTFDGVDYIFERTPSLYSCKAVYVMVETFCITNFKAKSNAFTWLVASESQDEISTTGDI